MRYLIILILLFFVSCSSVHKTHNYTHLSSDSVGHTNTSETIQTVIKEQINHPYVYLGDSLTVTISNDTAEQIFENPDYSIKIENKKLKIIPKPKKLDIPFDKTTIINSNKKDNSVIEVKKSETIKTSDKKVTRFPIFWIIISVVIGIIIFIIYKLRNKLML